MIRHILFDLDCTLYSARYGLEDNVHKRMMEYLATFFGMSVDEAAAEREKHIGNYGTTMEWLVAEKGFTAIQEYMECLHPEDEADSLPPDPELRRFLLNLPCPCSVLTNASGSHASRIIKKLGLEGIFVQVSAIEDNGYKGKPHASAFRRTLGGLGLEPEEVLFVDDLPRYVEGYLALGGRGILFDEMDAHADYPGERVKSIFEIVRFLD